MKAKDRAKEKQDVGKNDNSGYPFIMIMRSEMPKLPDREGRLSMPKSNEHILLTGSAPSTEHNSTKVDKKKNKLSTVPIANNMNGRSQENVGKKEKETVNEKSACNTTTLNSKCPHENDIEEKRIKGNEAVNGSASVVNNRTSGKCKSSQLSQLMTYRPKSGRKESTSQKDNDKGKGPKISVNNNVNNASSKQTVYFSDKSSSTYPFIWNKEDDELDPVELITELNNSLPELHPRLLSPLHRNQSGRQNRNKKSHGLSDNRPERACKMSTQTGKLNGRSQEKQENETEEHIKRPSGDHDVSLHFESELDISCVSTAQGKDIKPSPPVMSTQLHQSINNTTTVSALQTPIQSQRINPTSGYSQLPFQARTRSSFLFSHPYFPGFYSPALWNQKLSESLHGQVPISVSGGQHIGKNMSGYYVPENQLKPYASEALHGTYPAVAMNKQMNVHSNSLSQNVPFSNNSLPQSMGYLQSDSQGISSTPSDNFLDSILDSPSTVNQPTEQTPTDSVTGPNVMDSKGATVRAVAKIEVGSVAPTLDTNSIISEGKSICKSNVPAKSAMDPDIHTDWVNLLTDDLQSEPSSEDDTNMNTDCRKTVPNKIESSNSKELQHPSTAAKGAVFGKKKKEDQLLPNLSTEMERWENSVKDDKEKTVQEVKPKGKEEKGNKIVDTGNTIHKLKTVNDTEKSNPSMILRNEHMEKIRVRLKETEMKAKKSKNMITDSKKGDEKAVDVDIETNVNRAKWPDMGNNQGEDRKKHSEEYNGDSSLNMDSESSSNEHQAADADSESSISDRDTQEDNESVISERNGEDKLNDESDIDIETCNKSVTVEEEDEIIQSGRDQKIDRNQRNLLEVDLPVDANETLRNERELVMKMAEERNINVTDYDYKVLRNMMYDAYLKDHYREKDKLRKNVNLQSISKKDCTSVTSNDNTNEKRTLRSRNINISKANLSKNHIESTPKGKVSGHTVDISQVKISNNQIQSNVKDNICGPKEDSTPNESDFSPLTKASKWRKDIIAAQKATKKHMEPVFRSM